MTDADKDKTATVLRTMPETAEVTSLEVEDGRIAGWKPGQFATLRILTEEGWSEPHPFTISSAPEEGRIRFTIKKSGLFTSRIPHLAPGESIQCAGPFGAFCRDIDSREDIVMIAGGVGITPFLSVLRHFRATGARNLVLLFWVNKTLADAFQAEELKDMTRELNLRVVHVLTREIDVDLHRDPDAPGVFFEGGRLSSEILARHLGSPTSSFYLCGPPGMQEFVLDELQACGIDPARVEKEKFLFRKPPTSTPGSPGQTS